VEMQDVKLQSTVAQVQRRLWTGVLSPGGPLPSKLQRAMTSCGCDSTLLFKLTCRHWLGLINTESIRLGLQI